MDRNQKIEKRRKIVRIASIGVFLMIAALVTILVYPYAKDMGTASGRERMIEMFDRFDTFRSVVIFILIQSGSSSLSMFSLHSITITPVPR